jgi:capsular polysaccharide biosynthesis protein
MTHGTETRTPPPHLRRGTGGGTDRSGLPPMDPPVPPPHGPPATGGNGGSWSDGLYVRALRRWWWLPALAAVIASGTAWILTSRQTPQYAATATAIVAPVVDLSESSELLRSLDTLERRTVVATFARLAGTREVRMAAAEHLGLANPDVRGHRISASVVSSTNLIRLRAEGPDAQVAAALANAAVQVTEAEVRRLYQIFSLHTLEAATPPVRPFHPDPQRNVGVGVVLGLFLGLLAAVGLEVLRGAGRSTQEARVGV